MSSEAILYDLPSNGRCACWSLNPWKTRASLNYKGIPYHTEWVEYPDLKSTLSALGIPPNEAGGNTPFDYSSPAAKLPDGKYVMESRKIAEALDRIQPEPSLHTGRKDVIDRAQELVTATFGELRPVLMPKVPELLNPRSAEYFHRTRSEKVGVSLAELARSEKAQNAWENVQPKLKELKEFLTENKGGPYVLGRDVGFADFVVVGFFVFVRRLDQALYEKIMAYDQSFPELLEACEKWFQRDY